MKKIKVMHVLCMNTYSGAENVAITIMKSLQKEIDCVYVSPDGIIREIVENNGIEHYAVEKISISEIKRAIKDIHPDIIHAHDFTAGTVCAIAAGKIPIVNHLHNNTPWLKKICLKSLLYFASCVKYKKILTVSDSVMDEFIFGALLKNKSLVIGNPINIEKILMKANEDEILNESSDIVFLGRLTAQKRPLFFLDIIFDITKKIKNLRVAMIGTGELYAEVEDKIDTLKLGNHVKLYGFQNNPYGLLKASKVMCMPSDWEGFGLAAVEGLAFGKPVVASPVGGLSSIINDSCGKLCTKREKYVSELYKLLTNPAYYENKSIGAVKRASDFDNINQYSEVIKNIYENIAGVK